jgi:hypothetical protein
MAAPRAPLKETQWRKDRKSCLLAYFRFGFWLAKLDWEWEIEWLLSYSHQCRRGQSSDSEPRGVAVIAPLHHLLILRYRTCMFASFRMARNARCNTLAVTETFN